MLIAEAISEFLLISLEKFWRANGAKKKEKVKRFWGINLSSLISNPERCQYNNEIINLSILEARREVRERRHSFVNDNLSQTKLISVLPCSWPSGQEGSHRN